MSNTILINDVSINGNTELNSASKLSETLQENTVNALGVDASSRTIWVNGQPYGNAYVNIIGNNVEAPLGAEIFNDFVNNEASGQYSHAEGNGTTANGEGSHAEGHGTVAGGFVSHAEGAETNASGKYSHAEGNGTTASSESSHAEGTLTKAEGIHSHAEGFWTSAEGGASHTEGQYTTATAWDSHAEGFKTTAKGLASHSEGESTDQANITEDDTVETVLEKWTDVGKKFSLAYGAGSHVEGKDNLALGDNSHAEGYRTNATGNHSHTEGAGVEASGTNSHAEGSSTSANGDSSHAEGNSTHAIGENSHAEGVTTTAEGENSHAEGQRTKAIGVNSHAEGQKTTAGGDNSHVEGSSTTKAAILEEDSETDIYNKWIYNKFSLAHGDCSHAEGLDNLALGDNSHAEGFIAVAKGENSHAEGHNTFAEGDDSHAEGGGSTAKGEYSHAEGYVTTSKGNYSHAEGNHTTAYGDNSHAEGYSRINANIEEGDDNATIISKWQSQIFSLAYGDSSHVEGFNNLALGHYSHAEGDMSLASGNKSHAEGENTKAYGTGAHTEGGYGEAKGEYSHAEGYLTIAKGDNSHAEGFLTTAYGDNSHAEGWALTEAPTIEAADIENGFAGLIDKWNADKFSLAYGKGSHVEGQDNLALGDNSHAEGGWTKAHGPGSHAEGGSTLSIGLCSHAEGYDTTAQGSYSHAEGEGTITTLGNDAEHAQGRYNASNTNTIHSVGIGTSINDRKNAYEILKTGEHYIYNLGGYDGTNPSVSKDIATILSTVDTSDIKGFTVEKTLTVTGGTTLSDLDVHDVLVMGDLDVDGTSTLNNLTASNITATGRLTIGPNKYPILNEDYTLTDDWGLDCNNSDVISVNSLVFNRAYNATEGILFGNREGDAYSSMWIGGEGDTSEPYFSRNVQRLIHQVDWNMQTYNIYYSGANLKPSTTGAYDIGTSNYRFKHLYLSGNIYSNVNNGGLVFNGKTDNAYNKVFIQMAGSTVVGYDNGKLQLGTSSFPNEINGSTITLNSTTTVANSLTVSDGKLTTLGGILNVKGTTTFNSGVTIGSGDTPASLSVFGSGAFDSSITAVKSFVLSKKDGSNYTQFINANADGNSFSVGFGNESTLNFKGAATFTYGAVTIGIDSTTGNQNLTVYGNAFATAFYERSDATKKDVVSNLDVDFDKLKQIPKVNFTWKNDTEKKNNIGTIAQELNKVYPELVNGEEGNMTVDYAKLSIIALAAIDKLEDRIKQLEDKLYQYENKLS